jgi:hypothetical protein
MEQLNKDLPEEKEEKQLAAVVAFERKPESPLLTKVRKDFGVFGGISIIFGVFFALWFYKAVIGLNVLLFTIVLITLLCVIMRKLSLTVKTETKLYYGGAILLGISTTLTTSETLHFLNILGILFLLDLSLLHQFYEDHSWDFTKHLGYMFGLVFQSIAAIGKPFVDCTNFLKHTKILKNDKARNILAGILISIPFLWVIMALLSNADLLFGKLTKSMVNFTFSSDVFAVGFMILFGFLACYCILCGALSKAGTPQKKDVAKADASIAITVMTILCLVYVVFCGIQLVYLFTSGLFILPEEFTFAEYARRGFFELLAVTIINISLMLLCKAFFKESRLLRIILTCMTICTYILIISATYRMLLYIGAYHLTFLRVFVLLALFIDALVLTGVIYSEYNKKFPLFRYCVAVISVCYIAFSLSKPDYYIASYLIDQVELLDQEDMMYLTYDLSLDAAPVVLPLLADGDRWTIEPLANDDNYDSQRYTGGGSKASIIDNYYLRIDQANESQDFREFNYSNYSAARWVKEYPKE